MIKSLGILNNKEIASKAGSAIVWKTIQLAGTKGIYFLRTLVLAYILLPEDFGLFAVTLTAVEFLMSASDFGLLPALIHQDNPDKKQYDLVWSINFLRGLIVSTLVFSFAPFIANVFSQPDAASLIRFAAVKPLLEHSASIKIAELNRKLKFSFLAYLKLSDALVGTIVALIFASVIGVWGLVLGLISGTFVSSVLSYILAPYKPSFYINLKAAKPIIRFSKWIYLSVLCSLAAGIVIQIAITRELGLTEMGLYFLALHIAYLPSEIIKEIFGSVMFPVFAQIRNDRERLTLMFKSFYRIIIVLLVPVSILLLFTAPYFVQYILSDKWKGTILLIQIFIIQNIIGIPGESAVPLFTGTGRTKILFIIELVQTLIVLVLIVSFIRFWEVNGAAAAWVPAIFLSQIFTVYFLSKVLIQPFKGTGVLFFLVTLSSLIGAATAYMIMVNYPGQTGFICGILSSLVIICVSILFTDNYFKLGIRRNFLLAFPNISLFGKTLLNRY